MADLKTNYLDDVLTDAMDGRRRYQMLTNNDSTVSFVDVTDYLQEGSRFGAKDVNDINSEVNGLTNQLAGLSFQVVTALPASPNSNTVYIVTEG